jgi:hypothetical protein
VHERRKSDGCVVPAKLASNAAQAVAKSVEEKHPAKENTAGKTRPGHRAGSRASSALVRVRQVAQGDKQARFTALLHRVSVDRRRAAFCAIRPEAAPGVDGVTRAAYRQDLEDNLHDLHARLHAGRYRVKPSRRVYIPKADGRQRPDGVRALYRRKVERGIRRRVRALRGRTERRCICGSSAETGVTTLELDQSLRVTPSPALMGDLKELLGPGCLGS